jgi:hypothetical protein
MRGNFLPDKEFRYLRHFCYSLRDFLSHRGLGHFCPAPHVAMGVGLYLHPQTFVGPGIQSLRIPQ